MSRSRAALYCRLSREDAEKNGESESIQNQKALLCDYAKERGWDIWEIYCDEDYSGADSTRPAFNRLLAEAREGHFDIVLVKTQSRFTRDMELVEKYIHGLFPLWGIRFVAVVDNADTNVRGNKKARQINGLINAGDIISITQKTPYSCGFPPVSDLFPLLNAIKHRSRVWRGEGAVSLRADVL